MSLGDLSLRSNMTTISASISSNKMAPDQMSSKKRKRAETPADEARPLESVPKVDRQRAA